MSITEKLNTSWASNEQSSAVFQVRAAMQNLKNVADETKVTVDALTAGSSFATVDQEIKDGHITIGFSIKRLLKCLTHFTWPVTMSFTEPSRAVIINNEVLLMPMMING